LAEHLNPYLLAAYEEPAVLRAGPAREALEPFPRFRGRRQDLVAVFQRWAHVGRFGVVPARGVAAGMVTQIAAVPKDRDEDRQILDERGPNSVEDRLWDGPSRHLPCGQLLLDVHLEPDEQLVLGTKDRRSFYHQFEVTEARMRRTPVGTPLTGAELAAVPGCEALDPRAKFLGCFKGLGMGDHAAVDFALGGHETLLQSVGALDDLSWVRGDRPVPGGDVLTAVIIDDLAVVAKAPRRCRPSDLPVTARPDLTTFARAEEGYVAGGMPGAPEKDRVGESTLTLGGVELEGVPGFGGSPRTRLLPLAMLSMKGARLQETTQELAETMAGNWTAAFLSRRPLLTVLHRLYGVQGATRKRGTYFPRSAASELVVAAALAPLAVTDVRAPYHSAVYATDASPTGGGVVVIEDALTPEVADTLWRRRERRGGYSRLEGSAVETARAFGVLPDIAGDCGGLGTYEQDYARPPCSSNLGCDVFVSWW
jgi:hypothetical protein